MKLRIALMLAMLLSPIVLMTQTPLTPALALSVKSDANGYLIVAPGAYTAPSGPLTSFSTIRLRTDSQGQLMVTLPATGDGVVPTGVAAGSVLASNGVAAQGVWTDSPTVTKGLTGNGTAAAPSWSFTNDTGTGFYRTFLNQIGISNNGVESFIFANAANSGLRAGSGVPMGWSSQADPFNATNDTGFSRLSSGIVAVGNGAAGDFSGSIKLTSIVASGKVTTYNNVTTTGWGVPSIVASGRVTGQTAANASITTYTVGAADGSFEISGNVLATVSTTYSFNLVVAWTDEGNTARTQSLTMSVASGLGQTITNTTGPVFNGVPLHLRCKAATAITLSTSGTFTTVTYNAEGSIRQIS